MKIFQRSISVLLISTIFIPALSYSQTSDTNSSKGTFFFIKTQRVFKPLEASVFEPRVGAFKDVGADYLRLDIGVEFDLIGYEEGNNLYSFGVDFFTFSNLRTESNFKFPVDAIDYFFGVNFNYKTKLKKNLDLSSRIRISHISSHFEDGHIYERTDTIFTPVVYSREFINIAGILDYKFNDGFKIRNLLGIEYLIKTIPDEFGAFSFQYGIELRYMLNKWLTYYLSDEVRAVKVDTISDGYNLNNNLETGFRIGFAGTRGLNLFFTYYDGQDYKGQYYYRMTNYKAIGFSIDF